MKDEILIVDDSKINRDLLAHILEDDYAISFAQDGLEAISVIERKKTHLKLILLDLLMPQMDGFEVLRQMKSDQLIGKIPVIIISSENDESAQLKAFEYGVSDYIAKPFGKEIVKRRASNIIDLYDYRNHLEEKLTYQTNQLKTQYDILMKQAMQLQDTNHRITLTLGSIINTRFPEGSKHIERVAAFTKIIAHRFANDYPDYSISKDRIELISLASTLHDIGKLAIPDSIIFKPQKLTEEEAKYLRSHPSKGYEIIEEISKTWDNEFQKICKEIVKYHHERYDGSGYPEGLSGDNIPISAQIVSIADTYENLTSDKIRESAYSPQDAVSMILKGECGIFSSEILDSFRRCKNELV